MLVNVRAVLSGSTFSTWSTFSLINIIIIIIIKITSRLHFQYKLHDLSPLDSLDSGGFYMFYMEVGNTLESSTGNPIRLARLDCLFSGDVACMLCLFLDCVLGSRCGFSRVLWTVKGS